MKKQLFKFKDVDYYFYQVYEDGVWQDPIYTTKPSIEIAMTATSLHYGQQAFEGMKAYLGSDDKVRLFRPLENAKRFRKSCYKMMMPEVSDDHFLDAITQTILKNVSHMPKTSHQESLYVRPYMIGVGNNIGLRPAPSYIFGVVVTPVGTYFDGDDAGDYLIVEEDRVAPLGTGQYKVGGNYGAVLRIQYEAKELGYTDALFLDPLTHTKIDEFGGANIFFIKDNTFITPSSNTILKSITNDALIQYASLLGLKVEKRDVLLSELDTFEEAGACGTAASVSPIGSLTYRGQKIIYGHSIGPKTKLLKTMLLETQYGQREDTLSFTHIVK